MRKYGLKYLGVSGVARAAEPKAAEHADGVCYIGGHVHRPGAYYIHPGETTLGEVIENAGVEAAANSHEVVVLVRHADAREQILELDLQKLLSSRRDRSDPKLIAHPGDQLMVGTNPKARHPAE